MWECEFWNDEEQENAFIYAYSPKEAEQKARDTLGDKWYLVYSEYID